MAIDIERLLKEVVREVFGDASGAEFSRHPKYAYDWRASIISTGDPSREVVIRATYEWFTADIPDLHVGTIVFEYADDKHEKETALRELARAMRTYLEGGGEVGIRRTFFGLRQRPFVMIDSDRKRWVLGRHSSSISSS